MAVENFVPGEIYVYDDESKNVVIVLHVTGCVTNLLDNCAIRCIYLRRNGEICLNWLDKSARSTI